MKFGLKLIFVYLNILAICQNKKDNNKMIGRYHFFNGDSLVHYMLNLKGDSSFDFLMENDIHHKKCSGHWGNVGDTLFLWSKYQKDNILISVTEGFDTRKKNIDFGLIKDLRGNLISTSLLYLDNDTTRPIDLLQNNYEVYPGKFSKIRISVGDAFSNYYTIRNPVANKFRIVLNLTEKFSEYLFLNRQQLLFSKGNFLYLKNGEIDSITVQMRNRVPVLLVKE